MMVSLYSMSSMFSTIASIVSPSAGSGTGPPKTLPALKFFPLLLFQLLLLFQRLLFSLLVEVGALVVVF